jgi:tRNA 5-methylaminomethyl-2-thiouridine biosynthesis bifunctional protein
MTELDRSPWFAPPPPLEDISEVAIIGAGIAGCCLARALAAHGFSITLYEAGTEPASGASGTPSAIVQPRPYTGDDANAVFHAAAYLRAIQLYDELEAHAGKIWLNRGLLVVGRDREDATRYKHFTESDVLAEGEMQWLDADSASEKTGCLLAHAGAWFPSAGSLDTIALCRALSDGVPMQTNVSIARAKPIDGGWQLIDGDGEVAGEAPVVVFTAGHTSMELSGFDALGLTAKRGQVTLLPPNEQSKKQSAPLTYGGYLTPAMPLHAMGATFKLVDDLQDPTWASARTADDAANRGILAARLPKLADQLSAPVSAWVGLRATTVDRFPVVGGVPDAPRYEIDYADLRHGAAKRVFLNASYRQGLYCMSGLGSRGFLTAPLAADILAAMITGTPLPQPRLVLDALHPARFLIRDLKRRGRKATIRV